MLPGAARGVPLCAHATHACDVSHRPARHDARRRPGAPARAVESLSGVRERDLRRSRQLALPPGHGRRLRPHLDATSSAERPTRVERLHAGAPPEDRLLLRLPDHLAPTRAATATSSPATTEELFVVRQQAARLGSVCRVFAPVYRQVTLTALLALLGGTTDPGRPRASPTATSLDAWKHYIANDNDGRGVVLIGHSQGAGLLTRAHPERDRSQPRAARPPRVGDAARDESPGARRGGRRRRLPEHPALPHARQTSDARSPTRRSARRRRRRRTASSAARARPGWQAACTNPASLGGRQRARCTRTSRPTGRRCRSSRRRRPRGSIRRGASRSRRRSSPCPRFVEAECAEHERLRLPRDHRERRTRRPAHRRHRRRPHAGVGPPPGRRDVAMGVISSASPTSSPRGVAPTTAVARPGDAPAARHPAKPAADSRRSRSNAALISARCVKACGKLPRCSPAGPSSSAYRPRWLA